MRTPVTISDSCWVRPLSDLAAAPLDLVGSKARNLARLIQHGYPVPQGWCVLASAYRQFASNASALPAPLRQQLAAVLKEGPFAVRSSATAEDLAGRSFAGLYDTVLGPQNLEECQQAVLRCWASLRSDRATAYAKRFGIDLRDAAMAVVIQPLIQADAAGVVFCSDPTGRYPAAIVIEAVPGLGEALVSGRSTPDRFVLSKDAIVERSGRNSGMADDTLLELGRLARRAELDFGGPQDLEWALRGSEIFVLQSRPITATPQKLTAWTNMNAGEVLPDVVTPLTWSLIERLEHDVFQAGLTFMGFQLGPHPLVGRVAGRVYFNLSTLAGLVRAMPSGRLEDLGRILGGDPARPIELTGIEIPVIRLRWTRLALALPTLALRFLECSPLRGQTQVKRLARQRETLLDPERIGEASNEKLKQAVQELSAGMFRRGRVIAVPAVGVAYIQLLGRVCRAWLKDVDGSLAQKLLSGLGGMDSADTGLDLWRLASLARHKKALAEWLESDERFETLRARLPTVEGGPAFLEAWQAFLRKHGHHAAGEIELYNLRWSEDPERILELVRGYLRAPQELDPPGEHCRRQIQRGQIVAQCRARLRNPLKRWLFNFILRRAEHGALARENIKSEAVRWIALARACLLELGRRSGLARPDDIFFLTLEEALRAPGSEIRGQVLERRAEHAKNQGLHPPALVLGDLWACSADAKPSSKGVLTGLGVSPGVVRGPARVLLRPSQGQAVQRGEVLVAPFTDPGWTPYLLTASALVTDLGGLLSHGSIIARELGIPAVANTQEATRRIKTGQLIEVDGTRGRVTVLDESTPGTENGVSKNEINQACGSNTDSASIPDPLPRSQRA